MQIVIDIPEDAKAIIDKNGTNEVVTETIWQAVKNGTPLVDYLVELKAEIIKAMVDYKGTDSVTVDCAALDIIDRRTGRKFKEEEGNKDG